MLRQVMGFFNIELFCVSERRNIYNPPREATELVETAS